MELFSNGIENNTKISRSEEQNKLSTYFRLNNSLKTI